MTTATAQLCGHRWPVEPPASICSAFRDHRCDRPAGHQRDMMLRQPQQCRCRCGATTTRKDTAA